MDKGNIEKNNHINLISQNKKIPLPKYNSFTSKKHPKQNFDSNNNLNINKDICPNDNLFPAIDLNQKIMSSFFFKKYKPIKLIGSGTFSLVYEGLNLKDKTKVALKIEEKNSKISLLKSEALNIFDLQGFGIIKFISFGHSKDFNVLVEPLLGECLYSLFLRLRKNFTLKDICLIGIQTLERIEYIHSKGYLHGDIKPENFVIGINDQRIIYIIDFGLSKKYRSDRTGNHIQFCITKKMNGTARYASTNSLRGVEISRRDDLESLAYMILYFLMKKLPWQGVRANTLQNRYKKIYYMKKNLVNNDIFKSLPEEIKDFYKDIKKLKFEEKPNYSKLKEYFSILLMKNGLKEDGNFSWIKKGFSPNYKEINLTKRKSNSQKRLMDKLLKNSNQLTQNEKKDEEEEEHHNMKFVNSFKYKLSKKNNSNNFICKNNEFPYNSSNNKDIKSINEAINIDVGEFSENEEEKPKIINNNIDCKKLRKFNSDINRKGIINGNEKKENDFNDIYNQNNKYDIINKKIECFKKDYYNKIEVKNFISFNKKPKIEYKNENNKNQELYNSKNNFQRCNINKNYLINNFKPKKNNILNNDENINIQNIQQDLNNYEIKPKEKFKEIKNNKNTNTKRSKSGEKCSIQ